MKKDPFVTVIVFNYNGKELIKPCLDSVLSQTYKNKEVVFFDNGSTDGSDGYVKKNYPRVKLMRITPNAGIATATQRAFEKAKGDYIASLHIDAVADKNWLAEMVKMMEAAGPDVACVQSMVYQELGLLDGSLNILAASVMNHHKGKPEKFYAGTASMLVRNGLTKTYCDPDYFFYGEDVYLGWIMRLKGYKNVRSFTARVDHKGTYSRTQKTRAKYQFLNERNRWLNILSFYQKRTLLKVLPLLLVGTVLKVGGNLASAPWKVKANLKAYGWLLTHGGTVLKKRAHVQSHRKVPDHEITKHMTAKMVPGDHFANSLVEMYCRLVRLKTLDTP